MRVSTEDLVTIVELDRDAAILIQRPALNRVPENREWTLRFPHFMGTDGNLRL
jgi:hypothetical protein